MRHSYPVKHAALILRHVTWSLRHHALVFIGRIYPFSPPASERVSEFTDGQVPRSDTSKHGTCATEEEENSKPKIGRRNFFLTL